MPTTLNVEPGTGEGGATSGVDGATAAEGGDDGVTGDSNHDDVGADGAEEDKAKGEEAAAKGEEATVKGEEATVKGEEATVKGEEATVKGEEATVKGEEATVKGERQHSTSYDAARERSARETEAHEASPNLRTAMPNSSRSRWLHFSVVADTSHSLGQCVALNYSRPHLIMSST
jgi:hypothetical protein